ncbi:MAG TPA: DUF6273 domain-containing protein [Oscillospiraceae bacterium]|nr:DUF6273 domain-containing protein [Oscillospiraceae bacterium]HRW57054.1 DUF6273 domain-containing protein [Oscillospiraceae bacterium]
MRMCKRAAVCGIGAIRVTSVSTEARTGVSISSLTWKKLSAYSKAISQDATHTYSNAIQAVTFSDGRVLGAGDYLSIAVSGVPYRIDILGFHHDEVTDASAYGGDYAGITWQMHDIYATTYKMNSTTTNSGGWTSCMMRTSTMESLLSGLESGLSGTIVPVDKLTSAGSGSSTINTTSDSLFLLSEKEVRGGTPYTPAGEGTQYAYYVAGNSTVKNRNGSADLWWERSPHESSSLYFCTVNASGNASYDGAISLRGVSFAFCT